MRILFETNKFEKICKDSAKAKRQFGPENGSKLIRRIQELNAAPRLEDMRNMPGRCHELKGDLKGVLSIDVKQPLRLLFKPEPPLPLKDDGGLDWKQVEGIILCGVEDTHE